VDPARNLRPLSAARGLDVVEDYWGMPLAERITGRPFDLVLAIHVLPHVPDPKGFLLACKEVLAPGGRIWVQTSQCGMFDDGEFDAIYHEHASYFTSLSFGKLAEAAGLAVAGAWKVPIHSASFLFELARDGTRGTHDESFLRMLAEEEARGAGTLARYEAFARRAEETKAALAGALDGLRRAGVRVVGYGAAAKGSTLLNWMGLRLEYIVDDNPMKQGLLAPGTEIPVVPPERLAGEREPVAVLALAWNFLDEIRSRVRAMGGPRHRFVRCFPRVEVLP
jgi:hypothetical protein